MINLTTGEKVWQAVVYFILILLSLMCLLPFLYVVAVSVTPESEVLRRGIVIIPETFTFLAYKEVFISHGIGQAYKITLFRTIVGTALNVFFTVIAAYPLSKKYLPGRSPFLLFIVFTMMFGGGLIPTYLLVRSLGLLNSPWVLIIPQLISAFNLVIIKGFLSNCPQKSRNQRGWTVQVSFSRYGGSFYPCLCPSCPQFLYFTRSGTGTVTSMLLCISMIPA